MDKPKMRLKQDRRTRPRIPTEDIARRAYQLYEERGCGDGHDWDDWFQSERELQAAVKGPVSR